MSTSIYNSTIETGGGGTADYVYSSVSFMAEAGIEGLFLMGSTNIDATGADGQADLLAGNSGNNFLFGLSGNDALLGGAGSDYFLGGTGADYFIFNSDVQAGQSDVIGDFQTGVDQIRLPTYLRGSISVVDTAYGVDIVCYVSGAWYQIFVSNTHSVAQVTASISYFGV